MLLFTYSFDEAQNFEEVQMSLEKVFSQAYHKKAINFKEYGRTENELSLLFIENQIRIFYSLPRCDEYDYVDNYQPHQIKNVLSIIYDLFKGNIDLSAHMTYNDSCCPVDSIFHYLPELWKEDDEKMLEYLQENANSISCSLHTSPQTSKEILFTVNTYDMDKSSIFNVIDGKAKSDFIPRFFSLVSLLYRR